MRNSHHPFRGSWDKAGHRGARRLAVRASHVGPAVTGARRDDRPVLWSSRSWGVASGHAVAGAKGERCWSNGRARLAGFWKGRRGRWALALVGLALSAIPATLLASSAGAAGSGTPAADCQPFSRTPCLLPFPSNLFTRRDRSTPTGLRVRLPANAMPVNTRGQRIGVAQYDRNDGFSPGSAMIVHVPGSGQRYGVRADRRGRGAEHGPGVCQEPADRRDRRKHRAPPADLLAAGRQRPHARDHQPDDHPGQGTGRGSFLRGGSAPPARRQRQAYSGRRAGSLACATIAACRATSARSDRGTSRSSLR